MSDLRSLLTEWGLSAYVDKILDEGFTTVDELFALTDDDLKQDLGFTKLADRRKLTSRLDALKRGETIAPSSPTPARSVDSTSTVASSSSSSSSLSDVPAPCEKPENEPATQQLRDPFTVPAMRDLIARLRQKEVVLLVGSGLSVAATFDPSQKPPFPQALSWTGLLKHGIHYAMQLKSPGEADAFEKRLNGLIDAGEIIPAASELCKFLQQEVDAKHFEYFLREAFDPVKPTNDKLARVLRALVSECGIRVTTTNYDNLLEDQLGLPPLHYSDHSEYIDEWIRGRCEKVFHWHGHYKRPGDVILDTEHYKRIVSQHKHVQAAMGGMAVTKTFLFLGCGSGGLSDPNWGKLMQRMHDIGLSDRFALCTLNELPSFAVLKGLIAIPYGTSYGELVPFLYRLYKEVTGSDLDDSTASSSSSSSSSLSTLPAALPSPALPSTPVRAAPIDVASAETTMPLCPSGHVMGRGRNNYAGGKWVCDRCRALASETVERMVCVPCQSDLCPTCTPLHVNRYGLRDNAGHLLAMSSFAEGAYASGWVCNNCRQHLTGYRWFCGACHDDFCSACFELLGQQKLQAGGDAIREWTLTFVGQGSRFSLQCSFGQSGLNGSTRVPFSDVYGSGYLQLAVSGANLLMSKQYVNSNNNALWWYVGQGSWAEGRFTGVVSHSNTGAPSVGNFELVVVGN